MNSRLRVAICFVEPQDYAEYREICADGDKMSDDYATYMSHVVQSEKDFTQKGAQLIRVLIRPADLALWCQQTGRNVDAEGRGDYAGFIAANANR